MEEFGKPVFFFDIDNCLYSRSKKIQEMMSELIDRYFITHLALSQKDAFELHQRYYKEYGLAIEGLVRYHKVEPLEYNRQVDDALPLEDVIVPDPELRRLLLDIDTSKRVVRLLEVHDLFEGITYCDYGSDHFVCKPHKDMFDRARRDAGVVSTEQCFFVDDSALNCKAAHDLGWNTAHLVEPGEISPPQPVAQFQISNLQELRTCYPQFFRAAR